MKPYYPIVKNCPFCLEALTYYNSEENKSAFNKLYCKVDDCGGPWTSINYSLWNDSIQNILVTYGNLQLEFYLEDSQVHYLEDKEYFVHFRSLKPYKNLATLKPFPLNLKIQTPSLLHLNHIYLHHPRQTKAPTPRKEPGLLLD